VGSIILVAAVVFVLKAAVGFIHSLPLQRSFDQRMRALANTVYVAFDSGIQSSE
jgi:hypothetical protein